MSNLYRPTDYVRPYGAAAPWNIPAASLATHSRSDQLVDLLWNNAPAARPGNFNLGFDDYTYPVYYATATTSEYTVDTVSWANLDGKKMPWDPAWTPAPGSDAQVIVLDPPTGREWNLWQVSFDGNTIRASNGNLVPGSYWSKTDGFAPSRGVGIPYYAMLVQPEEIAAGAINHALSMPIRNTAADYVAPATKSDGYTTAGIPMGTRFQLMVSDADIDAWIASLPSSLPEMARSSARIIAEALRDYGWFVTDTAGGATWQFEARTTAAEQWASLGLGPTTLNWKTYPQDLMDGLITPSRMRAIVPSNEYGSVTPPPDPDPDPQPVVLSIFAGNAAQAEGNAGTTAFTFTVTRSGNVSGASSAQYAVTGTSTSPANASDFQSGILPAGTVNLAPGEVSKVISIDVVGDTAVEPDESFIITLHNPTGATINTTTATGTIRNDDTPPPPNPDVTIGETGRVTGLTHQDKLVLFDHSYADPVVFFGPLSRVSPDPAVVRIVDLQNDRMTIRIQEPSNEDGRHTQETASYAVFEAGTWQLDNGAIVEIDHAETDARAGGAWQAIDFEAAFAAPPAVLSQIQTDNTAGFLLTRHNSLTTEGFALALQKEEKFDWQVPSVEKVGWLAISPGQGVWHGEPFVAGHTPTAVKSSDYQLSFGAGFTKAPDFFAALDTFAEDDPAGLRYRQLTANSATFRIQEDRSADTETSHLAEAVSFLAVADDATLIASPYLFL